MARIICVGDKWQSLYRFRGADSNAFTRIAEILSNHNNGLINHCLPINYRCDEEIIKHAQQWVPSLQGFSKSKGFVGEIPFGDSVKRANNDCKDIEIPDGIDGQLRSLPLSNKNEVSFAFLCRINLPLVITAYQLIGQGKKCCIIGRNQIGAPLKNIIELVCGDKNKPGYVDKLDNICDSDGDVIKQGFLSKLQDYYRIQSSKLSLEGYEKKLEALQQNVECLEVIAERVKDNLVESLLQEIDNLFVEEPTPGVISLSTIHRAKGLEWDVVFILRPDLLPHPLAKPNPDGSWSEEQQQEQNAQYVAATRARHRLYYVNTWPFGKNKHLIVNSLPIEEILNTEEQQEEISIEQEEISNTEEQNHTLNEEPKSFVDDGEPF